MSGVTLPIRSSLAGLDIAALGLALAAERASASEDVHAAVALYHEALEAQRSIDGAMPHALVGRLAVLYRRCGRHDDEVALLRRFQELHDSGPSATRYAARLTKALTLASRAARTETGALQSIRLSVESAQTRRRCRSSALAVPRP